MTLYPKLITDALAQVRYPGNGKDLIEAGMLDDDPRIDGMKVSFSIVFDKNPDPFMKSLFKSIEATIHREISPDVEVTITPKYRLAERPEVGKLLPQVKNIIVLFKMEEHLRMKELFLLKQVEKLLCILKMGHLQIHLMEQYRLKMVESLCL